MTSGGLVFENDVEVSSSPLGSEGHTVFENDVEVSLNPLGSERQAMVDMAMSLKPLGLEE